MSSGRYNRFVTKFSRPMFALALGAALLLGSCGKDIQNSEAVRQGVLDYLKERSKEIGIDMNSMDVKVTSVSFEKDVARAAVSFIPKGLPSNAGMSMNYVLDRKGDKWAVRGRQTNPASPHGVMPSGAAAGDGPSSGPLPAGHPGVGAGAAPGASGSLPAGHPPVGTKQ